MNTSLFYILVVILVSQALCAYVPSPLSFSGYIYQKVGSNYETGTTNAKSDQLVRATFLKMLQDVTSYITFIVKEPKIDAPAAVSMITDIVKIHSGKILSSSTDRNVDHRIEDDKNRATPSTANKNQNYIISGSELTNTVSNLLDSFLGQETKRQ